MNAPPWTTAGTAPLLLLPGTLCDGEVFGPVMDLLADPSGSARWSAVASLTGVDTVEAAAARILADAPARFAMLGFSLGGIVALAVAAAAPERVAGLALIGSNARDVREEDRPGRRAEALQGASDLERHVGQTLWPRYVAAGARDNEGIRRTVVAMALRAGGGALTPQVDMALSRPDRRPQLGALTMPALVLAGADDALCPPEMQREMALALPSATLALVADAGHFLLLERPEAAAEHIAAWLDRVDRYCAADRRSSAV